MKKYIIRLMYILVNNINKINESIETHKIYNKQQQTYNKKKWKKLAMYIAHNTIIYYIITYICLYIV